jgi:hypothetical protein
VLAHLAPSPRANPKSPPLDLHCGLATLIHGSGLGKSK